MKIYARQVSPESQESMLFEDIEEGIYNDFCIYGNRQYKSITTGEFDKVFEVLNGGELAEEILTIENGTCEYFNNVEEAITEYLPKRRKDGNYTDEELEEIKRNIFDYGYNSKDDMAVIANVLSIYTGREWDYKTIRGSCQSDWNYMFFVKDKWSDEAISNFEIEYFNTGSEWEIHDGNYDPQSAEEIEGYYVYCHGWNDEQIKQEIVNAEGGSVDDVILYKYAGSRSIPVYEMA